MTYEVSYNEKTGEWEETIVESLEVEPPNKFIKFF